MAIAPYGAETKLLLPIIVEPTEANPEPNAEAAAQVVHIALFKSGLLKYISPVRIQDGIPVIELTLKDLGPMPT